MRVALISRAIGSEGAAFTTIGVACFVGMARASIIAALFAVTVAPGKVLIWVGLALLTATGVAGVRIASGHAATGRAAHLLDVVRGLAARPAAAVEIFAWLVAGTGARLVAATCVGAALELQHPIAGALVIVPAIELAGLFPLTPGNLGVTSAAVALALRGHGVPLTPALATGIGLHAVETLVGLAFGGACALSFSRRPDRRNPAVDAHPPAHARDGRVPTPSATA